MERTNDNMTLRNELLAELDRLKKIMLGEGPEDDRVMRISSRATDVDAIVARLGIDKTPTTSF